MYCTYEQYSEKGGSMSQKEFEVWGFRASRMIDTLTMERAAKHADVLSEELADACAQIADIMKRNDDYQANCSNISSASTDGYSESYVSAESVVKNARKAIFDVLANSLGADRYNLLYAGLCLC